MSIFCPSVKSKRKGAQPLYKVIDTYKASKPRNTPISPKRLNKHDGRIILEIVEDFFPSTALELPVRAGERVEFIKNEGAWVFVRALNGADGFIPRRYCRICKNNSNIDKKTIYKRQGDQFMYGSLKSISELSDMGYYSDAPFNRYLSMVDVGDHSNFQRQSPLEMRLNDKGSFAQSSSSNSPASCSSDDRKQRTRKTSPVKPPRTKLSIYQQKVNLQPVCGRRCKRGCKHGVDLHNVEVNTNNENRYENLKEVFEKQKLIEENSSKKSKKPSITSVSSHKSSKNISSSKTVEQNLSPSCASNEKYLNILNNNSDEKIGRSVSMVSLENSIRDIVREAESTLKSHVTANEKPTSLTKHCGHPELIVMKSYTSQGDTDVSVECGDYARILNDTKYQDWVYVLTERNEKGFVPRSCVIEHTCKGCDTGTGNLETKDTKEPDCEPDISLMVRYDVMKSYSGKDLDDLYVCEADIVYKSREWQSIDGWTWVYSSQLKQWGYVPSTVLKETSEVV